jgi:hypothetical protein
MISTLPLALALYWLLEYVVRRASYCVEMEPGTFRPPWQTGHEWAIVVSPGFWLSHYFKSRIQHFPSTDAVLARSRLIKRSNWLNVLVSTIFLFFCLLTTLATRGAFGWSLVADLVVIRYISRTIEIGYAFGRDVMPPLTTGAASTSTHVLRSHCAVTSNCSCLPCRSISSAYRTTGPYFRL